MALDPVSVEITYGLERILIALQQRPGHLGRAMERRASPTAKSAARKSSNTASIISRSPTSSACAQMYDLYRGRGRGLPGAGLVLPAHDYVLKCSHTFNILDTRGAIGVDRAPGILRADARPGTARGRGLSGAAQSNLNIPLLKETSTANGRRPVSAPRCRNLLERARQTFRARDRHGRTAGRGCGCGAGAICAARSSQTC